MTNIDGEVDSSEFFNVYAEDGSLLGRTVRTDIQCGTSETNFTVNDKKLALRMDGRREASTSDWNRERLQGKVGKPLIIFVNNGSVSITADFDANISNNIIYEYTLDGGARQRIDPIMAFSQFLEVGTP